MSVLVDYELLKATLQKDVPLHAQELGAGEVALQNTPKRIDGQQPDGSKFIEIRILRQRILRFQLSAQELLILHLQLKLVDLKLMEQTTFG